MAVQAPKLLPQRNAYRQGGASHSTPVQKAIKKWEAIRRHDTDPKQRASLVSEVLKEVRHSFK